MNIYYRSKGKQQYDKSVNSLLQFCLSVILPYIADYTSSDEVGADIEEDDIGVDQKQRSQ